MEREERVEKLAAALRTAFAGDAEFEKLVEARFHDEWRGLAELVCDIDPLI